MLPVTIVDQNPETVYQDTVYEQVIVVETSTGKVFGVFDNDMEIYPSAAGDSIDLDIWLLPRSKRIKTIGEVRKEIVPNDEDPRGFSNHEFYGEIISLEEHTEDSYVSEIDVGPGTVLVYPFKSQNQHLSIGDTVYIEASRTDVAGIRSEKNGTQGQ